MYPVGVLFGFGVYYFRYQIMLTLIKYVGFDTASSIALLAVSAIAKQGPDGKSIPSAHIVILPVRPHLL
jgi:high-affinity nickel-transport protein